MRIKPGVSSFFLNTNEYFFHDLLNDRIPLDDKNEFEQHTLRFIREWLSEKDTFSGKTSGSTGTPKIIPLSRLQMQASAQATVKALGLQPGNKSLLCIPTRYIGGQMMLVRALEHAFDIYAIDPSSNPFLQLKGISTPGHFDFTALVPLQMQRMLEETPESIPNVLNPMKGILIGGGAVNASLHALIQQIEAPVYNTYGMTETVSHIALKRLNGPDASDYFKALDQVVLDVNAEECLRIKAPQTQHRWIQTNDRVRLLDHKTFEWLGRLDFVINSGGIKIQGEVVEKKVSEVFEQLSIPRAFFITGLPHEKLGQELHLIVEGTRLERALQESILQKLRASGLSKYEVPKGIRFVEAFVRTPTSKINRKATLQQ